MQGWIATFQEGLVPGVIILVASAAILTFGDWRRNRARLVDLPVGKPFTFDASLRGNTAPYPRRWRAGWVTVNAGPPTWKPRFSVMRRRVVLPMSATVEEIRDVAGLRDGISVDRGCRIIVARAGDVSLELAVFPLDLPAARQALESGSARGLLGPPDEDWGHES